MNSLNKKQLAFLLGIKVEDARAKMCAAWEKAHGIERVGENREVAKAERSVTNRIEDNYPDSMTVELLSKNLNLPDLQACVDDVVNKYLSRSASKKYILIDFPQNEIRLQTEKGKHTILKIPSTLRSFLPDSIQAEIKKYWTEKYSGKTVTISL